jgi:hypothetical protein
VRAHHSARARATGSSGRRDAPRAVCNWTRLSCHRFAANAVRPQLHALAYIVANFLRTLALPAEVSQWSMTTLRERLVKIGAKVVRHGRSVIFDGRSRGAAGVVSDDPRRYCGSPAVTAASMLRIADLITRCAYWRERRMAVDPDRARDHCE